MKRSKDFAVHLRKCKIYLVWMSKAQQILGVYNSILPETYVQIIEVNAI